MNAEAITQSVMDRITPWLGDGANLKDIRYAILRSHDSVISGLRPATTTEACEPDPVMNLGNLRRDEDRVILRLRRIITESRRHAFGQGMSAGWRRAGGDGPTAPAAAEHIAWSDYDKSDGRPEVSIVTVTHPNRSCMVCSLPKPFVVQDAMGNYGVCGDCQAAARRAHP